MGNILEVSNLQISQASTGKVIVPDLSFGLKQGGCLAIVGESGSGKSLTCKAIMRLNKPDISHKGEILFQGENLLFLSEKEMRKKRGKQLNMILQNGMRAFDPSCTIEVHLRETLFEHFGWNRKTVVDKMHHAMQSVMLKEPHKVMSKYPHQLSGGMLQRVMIALSIALEPEIIIADEPTTALDTVSKNEVIQQFIYLRERMACSMIFVSHDLDAVKEIADDVLIMKDGIVLERGSVRSVFSEPQHEYTRYLLSAKLGINQHFRKIIGGVSNAKG